MDPIRVMIADDQAELRSALADLVSADERIELVGTARDADEAIELAASSRPHVALIDVRMPGGGGVRATREIARRAPDTRVVAISAFEDRATVLDMFGVGAVGYLVKGTDPTEIVDAIVRASRGQAGVSSVLVPGMLEELGTRLQHDLADTEDERASRATIRRALEAGEPSIVVQPIMELAGRGVVGFEALARFTAEGWTTQEWFERAARLGLSLELELTSVRSALGLLPRIPPEAYLSLNVSHRTAESAELFRAIADTEPSRVVIEITEHERVEDYQLLARALAALRAEGVRVAIDDAGAGFASLRHILALTPDIIKLDISITAGIDSDQPRRAIAKALVSFGGEIGVTILAEGIETGRELETLLELGVGLGQGYHLARPAPLEVPSPRPRRPGTRST